MSGRAKKRKKRMGSIAGTMLIAFTLLIFVIIVINSIFSYSFTQEELKNNAVDYTELIVEQVNADIDRYVDYIKDISDIMSRNASVASYLLLHAGEEQDAVLMERVSQQLRNAMSIRKEISSMALIANDGRVVLSGGYGVDVNPYAEYKNTDWYKNAQANHGEVYVSSSHVQNLIAGEYRWVVTFAKAILDADGKALGVLIVDLNYAIINEICEKIQLGNRGYFFLLDDHGDVLWHPKQQLLYANLKHERVSEMYALKNGRLVLGEGEDQCMYVANLSASTGWIAVGVVYMNELIENEDDLFRFYLLIGAFSLVLAVSLCVFLSRAITNPLRKLTETMSSIEEGNFSVRANIASGNEIGRLSDNFNNMVEKTQGLMGELILKEEQKREAEWRSLQAQIKPHFLYNTLDSIIWMAHAGKTEEVVNMTVALASLLRTSIGSGDELVPLRDEIAHVRSYLTIQKMRYDDKLSYAIDISEELQSYIVPKLLLQPLVENAIYHGLKVKEIGGSILIEAMEEEGNLIITIEDTGVGMTKEQLTRIFETKDANERGGIGVSNVQERIRIHYGDAYGLKFFSTPDRGTSVLIVLPATPEQSFPGSQAKGEEA